MTHLYASADYARSLSHIGAPLHVPEWNCHLLLRSTPCGTAKDAVGTYPVTPIPADADLAAGLARLRAEGLVSVVLVVEDELRPEIESLARAFSRMGRFKSHHLYDRGLGPLSYSKHHRYEIRRALSRVVAAEFDLAERLSAWQDLYGELTARHGLGGLHDFPLAHHEVLSRLPGVRAFGAFLEDRLVSAHIFVTQDGHAMSHLAASSAEGYRNGAAYAVNDLAIAALHECRVINFGGGAGMDEDPSDGLVRFKKGFSNRIAPSYLCGAVLDAERYAALSAGRGDNGFFPAYRGSPRGEAMR